MARGANFQYAHAKRDEFQPDEPHKFQLSGAPRLTNADFSQGETSRMRTSGGATPDRRETLTGAEVRGGNVFQI